MKAPETEATGRDTETKEQLIERLLAKAELDFKCCGSHCSGALCHGEGEGARRE
jgi:hypothetical protein